MKIQVLDHITKGTRPEFKDGAPTGNELPTWKQTATFQVIGMPVATPFYIGLGKDGADARKAGEYEMCPSSFKQGKYGDGLEFNYDIVLVPVKGAIK